MYFLSHIRKQFLSYTINSFDQLNNNDVPVGDTAAERELAADAVGLGEEFNNMSTSELLEELKDRLEQVEAAESIVGPEAQVLIRFCNKVKHGDIAGLGPEDEDFVRLSEMACRKVEEYKGLAGEAAQINETIRFELRRIKGEVDKEIERPETNEVTPLEERQKEELERLETQRESYDGTYKEQLGEYTQEQQDSFSDETKAAIQLLKGLYNEQVEEDISLDEQIVKRIDINTRFKQEVEGFGGYLNYESQLVTRNNYKTTLEETETQLAEIDTGFAEARTVPEDIKTTLTALFEEEYTGTLEDKTARAEIVNNEISELMVRIETEVVIRNGISSRELTSEESAELVKLREEYEAIRPVIGEKLQDYLNSEVVPEPFGALVTRYNRLNEDYDTRTDSQEYDSLKDTVIPQLKAFDRIVDITLRDEGMIGPNGERLGALRLENTNEAYNKILENPTIKEAITSTAGKTPTFDELEMNHIHILKENGVNLAELFLVNSDGTSFSGSMQQGESYIINFNENPYLSGKLDFAFLTHRVEQINIDDTVFTFDQTRFNKDSSSFAMQDGSQIQILKLFGDEGEDSEDEREAAIDGAIEQYAASATQRQAIYEALGGNPGAAFEGDTLPKGLLGAIIAMILNFGDDRNFKYDPETGTWKDGPEEATNNDMIASGQGNYRYNGQSMDMSSSFEGLPPGVGGLVNIIYQAEAGGDPNIIYSGCRIRPPRPITDMTVRELQIFQDEMVAEQNARGASNVSSAIGACQVIRSTLDAAVASGLLDLDEKFNVDAQMRFTMGKMDERGLSRFRSGAMSEADFMLGLSQEWASLPKDSNGASYYNGHAGNRALVSPELIQNQLREIKAG